MTIIIPICSSIFSEHFVDLSFKARRERFPDDFCFAFDISNMLLLSSNMHILIEYHYLWMVIVSRCTRVHLCVCCS